MSRFSGEVYRNDIERMFYRIGAAAQQGVQTKQPAPLLSGAVCYCNGLYGSEPNRFSRGPHFVGLISAYVGMVACTSLSDWSTQTSIL